MTDRVQMSRWGRHGPRLPRASSGGHGTQFEYDGLDNAEEENDVCFKDISWSKETPQGFSIVSFATSWQISTMSGPWSRFIERSVGVLRDGASRMATMDGIHKTGTPRVLWTYRSEEDLKKHCTGCDGDLGGYSTTHLDMAPDGKARFHGVMRLDGPPNRPDLDIGWAGFRNRTRTTFWGHIVDDLSLYNYVALRIRASGELRTRDGYFVNIQCDGPVPSDLWQHRLYLHKESDNNTWDTVIIPFDSFILRSGGQTATGQTTMMKNRMRTIGISLPGANANISGRYELGVDYIGALSDAEDLDKLVQLVNNPEKVAAPQPRF